MTFKTIQNDIVEMAENIDFYKYIDSINNTQYSTLELVEIIGDDYGYCIILEYSNEKDFIEFLNTLEY